MNMENGSIINQYKIISAIGKGGMGEVYLAEDTCLDRNVAWTMAKAWLGSEFGGGKAR